jgi:hypothetical protein
MKQKWNRNQVNGAEEKTEEQAKIRKKRWYILTEEGF